MRITSLRALVGGRVAFNTRASFVSFAILRQRRLSACSFERIVHMELTPVNAVVRDCAVCGLVGTARRRPVTGVAEHLGMEVDDHPRVPVLLEIVGTMQSRSGPHLPILRRRLKKPKRWWPGRQQS